jgi:hypothetical protein
MSEKQRGLHCYHCGTAVGETVHTRSDYRVGFYELHTGEVEEVTRAATDTEDAFSYMKLVAPTYIVTCPDCYRRPEVAAEREALFRPEAVDG